MFGGANRLATVPVLKTVEPEKALGVRLRLPPPEFVECWNGYTAVWTKPIWMGVKQR